MDLRHWTRKDRIRYMGKAYCAICREDMNECITFTLPFDFGHTKINAQINICQTCLSYAFKMLKKEV